MRVTRAVFRLAIATALTAACGVATAGAAHAGPDDTTTPDAPGTYDTSVHVRFEGTAKPVPGATPPSPPPPVCWWEPLPDGEDPTLFAMRFRTAAASYGSADTIERVFMQLPNGDASLDDAVAAEEATDPPGVTWYGLKWNSDLLEGDDYYAALEEAGCTTVKEWREGSSVAVTFNYFTPDNVPAPQVDVEELARYARDSMTLVPPALEWNPKIRATGDAAMVNVPTWFWVRDPLAVAEDRFIVARIGPVWARVDALPNGVEIDAAGQRVTCTNAQARRRFALGRDERSGCILTFDRASHSSGTFEVRASTSWEAVWTSSTGEGGTFDPRIVEETTDVRVASTQTIVIDVD